MLKKNKKFIKYRINRFYRLNVDLFATVIQAKSINKHFKQLFNKYYRRSFRRPLNIFFRLINARFSKKKYNKQFNNVKFVKKLILFKFYKNLNRTQFKNLFNSCLKCNELFFFSFLNRLELRLDMFLYRSFSFVSLSLLTQLILHGHIRVNFLTVTYPNFVLKEHDLVCFNTQMFIRLYLMFKKKIKTKNKRLFLHKFPHYSEVSYKFLISLVAFPVQFKHIPFYFKVNKKIFSHLF